jgi:outer membrane protein assembly factor BamA
LKSKSTLYLYDRSDEPNQYPERSQAKLRTSRDTTVNKYNSQGFMYDRVGPVFRGNYNIDQGVQVGAGWMSEKQGFRRSPYASKQEFWVDYSTGRKSFMFDYTGNFKKVIGKNDLRVNVNYLGPNNLSNFFGIGNNTAFEKIQDDDDEDDFDREISYYRNRFDYLTTKVELLRELSAKWRVGVNLSSAYYTSDEDGNKKRFLRDFDVLNPEQDVFASKLHLGAGASATFDTRNNSSLPSNGVYWNTEVSAHQQVNGPYKSFGVVRSEFSFYLKPHHKDIVLSNKIGGGTTIGSPYFYQLMQLGGVNNLRGFHTRRFAGKTSLYHNLDLRFKLFSFNSYLVPGSVGLTGFNDVGRIWQPKEHSSTWHHGYGGGLYVVPAELILIQAAVGFSEEGTLPYISVAFNL